MSCCCCCCNNNKEFGWEVYSDVNSLRNFHQSSWFNCKSCCNSTEFAYSESSTELLLYESTGSRSCNCLCLFLCFPWWCCCNTAASRLTSINKEKRSISQDVNSWCFSYDCYVKRCQPSYFPATQQFILHENILNINNDPKAYDPTDYSMKDDEAKWESDRTVLFQQNQAKKNILIYPWFYTDTEGGPELYKDRKNRDIHFATIIKRFWDK
jgi:hypothetical protein